MDNSIKISVIIPAYNIERYILRCLKSVAAQDYKFFEAIVINDGSTDDTEKIIEQFISDKPNFKLKSQDNMGLSCARNSGIDISAGDYLMFLDGDDELEPGALSEMAHEIEKNNLDAVFFDAVFLQPDGTVISDIIPSYNRPELSERIQSGEKLFAECMKKHEMLVCACFYLFRRELLDKIGLRFYPGIIHEDCLFTPWLMFACHRVKHVNRQYYRYYNNSNSIMTSKSDLKEAENYGIVADELIKEFNVGSLIILARRYYRDYCISMYSMGKISFDKIENPDKELADHYIGLKLKTERLQYENRIYYFFDKWIAKIRSIVQMVHNG